MLERVEQIDAKCRSEHISAETARAALGFLQFPIAYAGDDAWDLLRGSPTPKPWTVDQARAWLSP